MLRRACTKEAAGLQRQNGQDHQKTNRALVGAGNCQERQLLGEADDEAAHHGARDAAEPSDDGRGEDREDGAEANQRID